MKTCNTCGAEKSQSEYYKQPSRYATHMAKCKECVKSAANEYRARNLEDCREYDRRRANDPQRMEKNRRIAAEYIERHPDRRKANSAVGNAVRDKRLIKWPCQVCGNPKSVGHHPDYSRPLDVVWLCQPHHKQAHALVKE